MKKTVSVALAAVLLILGLALSVSASSGSKTAELFFCNIKIMMNGQEITPKDANGNTVEPFIIDGTTYLPVRAVSGALGLNVEWDGDTNTVFLTEAGHEQPAINNITGKSNDFQKAYEKEILYNNFEWGISPENIKSQSKNINFISTESSTMWTWDNIDKISAPTSAKPYGHIMTDMTTDSVAGNKVFLTRLFFMYNFSNEKVDYSKDNEKLYMAQYSFQVLDIESAYKDLKQKMTDIYGPGIESTDSHNYHSISIIGDSKSGDYTIYEHKTEWHGANNTAVKIVSRTSSDKELGEYNSGLWITYGKTDVDNDLEVLKKLLSSDAVREENEIRESGGNSGL